MRFSSSKTLLIKIALISHFLKTDLTPQECCKKNNVPKECFGLCSIAEKKTKSAKIIEHGVRYTKCSEYEDVIDRCFLAAEPMIEGFLVFSIF